MAVDALRTEDLKTKLKASWEAKKAEAAAKEALAKKPERASISSVIAKQSGAEQDHVKTMSEAQNNDIVESLSKTVKVPKLVKATSH